MPQMDSEIEQLREAFGDEAEAIYRGLVIAYWEDDESDLSDALARVLQVRDAEQRGQPLHGLDLRIADALGGRPWSAERDGALDDAGGGAIACLREDYATGLGVFRAGTFVRIHDRLGDGEVEVEVFDLNRTVFPVPESLLSPLD